VANAVAQGVAATPGWLVIATFLYSLADQNTGGGTLTNIFRATVIASTAALDVNLRLVRADTLAVVAGSTLNFPAPVNATEQTDETADLTGVLVDGIQYQIEAECVGGATPGDFATIRYTALNAVFTP
jgi:hypothetical protein